MPTLVRGGAPLYYEMEGSGKAAPMIFLHGLLCDRTFFAPQAARFRSSRTVIALDLRGHGKSGKPRQEYSIDALADDVAFVCERLGLSRIVAVGHSMGGAVAVALAAAHPELCAAIVALDATLHSIPGRIDALSRLGQALLTPEGPALLRRYFEGMFEPTDDPDRRQAILNGLASAHPQTAAALVRAVMAWDGAAVEAVRCPFLYVGASRNRTDLLRLRQVRPQTVLAQVAASGHFLQLEVPDQVNAMIERFLATSLPADGAE